MTKELILVPKAKYEHLLKSDDTTVNDDASVNNHRTLSDIKPLSDEDYKDDTLESTLEYVIPKNRLKRALGLWNYLKERRGNILNWNAKGEIIVNGKLVPQSHIADVIKDAVTSRTTRQPEGYKQFYEALKELHTPEGFIINSARRNTQVGGQFVIRGKLTSGPPGQRQKAFKWIPY